VLNEEETAGFQEQLDHRNKQRKVHEAENQGLIEENSDNEEQEEVMKSISNVVPSQLVF
jgi:hypothetical protein